MKKSWVLVTGAAKGVGREIAINLAKDGYNTVIHYHQSKQEAEETAELCLQFGISAETIYGDFFNLSTFIEDYHKRFLSTHGLVNNVSHYYVGPLSKTDSKSWDHLVQLNIHAPFFLIQALLTSLKEHKGRVVNIGSVGVHAQRANVYCPAYFISKSSLWSITSSFAKELAKDEVTVNMVAPGILDYSIDFYETKKQVPGNRAITSEEIARVVQFLFKKESSSITGQNIEVAAGFGL
jgi:NAD(P)-dependent dehydrogenase (short-subunit alcohol dehydrogenase family)